MKTTALLGIIITALFGALWWQTQRAATVAEQYRTLEAATVEMGKKMAEQSAAAHEVQRAFQAARDAEAKDMEIFDDHDIGEILEKKPALGAQRATDGYGRMFDAIEAASRDRDSPTTETGRAEPTAD